MTHKFTIFSNADKDPDKKYLDNVSDIILSCGGVVSNKIQMDKNNVISEEILKDSDIIVSLGGDGTFLNIARQIYKTHKPILGINIGSLGFLSEIEIMEVEENIRHIVGNDYQIAERMMIEAKVLRNNSVIKELTALNDIVISRGEISRIVKLKTMINNSFVDSFPGDGVVISTPTGSTGYSLSAGGPVVDHNEKLIIITPICPHTMHARSYITSYDNEVTVEVCEKEEQECILTADGQKGQVLKGKDSVVITKSEFSVKVIKINKNCFYETLRRKIYNRR